MISGRVEGVNYTPSRVEGGGVEDDNGFWNNIITISNPFLRGILTPDLQYQGEPDPNWDLTTSKAFEEATPYQKNAMTYARSEAEATVMKARAMATAEAQEQLKDYSLLATVPASIIAGSVAPSTFLPIGGAAGFVLKQTNMARRMATGATIGATIGAGTGALDKGTGFDPEAEPLTYAAIGLVLGGGLSGISDLLAKTTQPERAAKAIVASTTTTPNKQGDVFSNLDAVPEVESKVQQWMPFKKQLLSAGQRLMDSPNPLIRKMAQRAVPSTIGGRVDGVPTPMNQGMATGLDYKIKLNTHQTRFTKGMQEGYALAKENGFNGSMTKFANEVQNSIYDALSYQLKHKTKPDVFHPNKGVDTAVSANFKYYNDMLEEGKSLGVFGVQNAESGKLYNPQMWDFDVIQEMDITELQTLLYKGMVAYENSLPIDKRIDDNLLAIAAQETASKLKTLGFDRDTMDASLITPKEVPLGTHTKSRTIDVDQGVVRQLLTNNVFDTTGRYHYKQSGQYALNYAYPEIAGKNTKEALDTLQDIFAVAKDVGEIRDGDLKDMSDLLKELLGTYRIPANSNHPSWRTVNTLKSLNSIIHGAGFVLNTAGELGVTVLSKGFGGLFKTKFSAIKDVQAALFREDGSLNTELAQNIQNLGLLMDINHVNAVSRHADIGDTFSVGKMEGVLNNINSGMYKWTGMRGATAALEIINGIGVVDKLVQLGKKSSWSDDELMMLSRLGVSTDIVKKITKEAQKDSTGLYNFNLDSIDPDVADALQTAVIREVEMSVPKPSSMFAPTIISEGNSPMAPLRKLATQFLSYPLTANQTIFMRGLSEDKKGMLIGSTISMMAMMSVMYLREQVAIATGSKEKADAKYDINTEKGLENLTLEAFGKNGLGGMIPTGLDYIAAIAGQEGITGSRGYVADSPFEVFGGPTIGKAESTFNLLQNILNGEFGGTDDMYAIKALTPFSGLPLWSEYLSHEIKY